METIQEILNFSVGTLTVGNVISAIVIFVICHIVIKYLMGPVERVLDKLKVDMIPARLSAYRPQSSL